MTMDRTKAHPVFKLEAHTLDSLAVITPVFNPSRYRTRIDLYHEFAEHCACAGARLFTIELALGERPWVVTDPNNHDQHQVRSADEMWHKERLINLMIERLPHNIKYIAWVDADVRFARPDWAKETIQLLQHFPIIQMFSKASDLGPNNEILNTHIGVMYAHRAGLITDTKFYSKYHPGFAWAARRSALDDLGGLLDIAILGAGDRHMAQAFLGQVNRSYPLEMSPGYVEQLQLWQKRALTHIRGDVGFMEGHLMHYWHGPKINRRYMTRWNVLIKNEYDPEFDLKRDTQGLHRFTDRNPLLRQDIRAYFMQRSEDDIYAGPRPA
jgi:hypothetical protein